MLKGTKLIFFDERISENDILNLTITNFKW